MSPLLPLLILWVFMAVAFLAYFHADGTVII